MSYRNPLQKIFGANTEVRTFLCAEGSAPLMSGLKLELKLAPWNHMLKKKKRMQFYCQNPNVMADLILKY